jgi:hypothetical protein
MLPQEWFTSMTRSLEMKTFIKRIAMALLITSLASIAVFAKTKKATVTFPTNIKVNGTTLHKGMYDLKFDDKTGELTIVKGSKIVARATVGVGKRDSKATEFEYRSAGRGDDEQLISVTFSGADHDLIINGSQASR